MDNGAKGDILHGLFVNGAMIRAQITGRGGRQIQQCADSVACPFDTPMLEQQRKSEQKSDRRRLKQLANDDRTDDGNDHKEVHVRPQATSRQQSLGNNVPGAAHN